MKQFKLAILGFGSAGKAFSKILLDKHKMIKETMGIDVQVVAVTTKTRGCLVNGRGIDLGKICSDLSKDGKFNSEDPGYCTLSSMEVVETVDYDVLIELTPLEIFTGQPAIDHIKGAFQRKKHVVTANKGPIAWAYKALKDMACQQGVEFFYETTVMDGTPVFNLVEETLKFCKVTEIKGILNSTTNFVLEEMAKGNAYDQIIEAGKSRGFIEADPAMDIEGWDAAAKTAALLNALMDVTITPDQIQRKGIEGVTLADIQNAEKEGKVIKLVCRGYVEAGKVIGEVKPVAVPKNHLFATISGTSSIVSITTDLMGTVTIVEENPEIEQTGYGVFSDLIRVIEKKA